MIDERSKRHLKVERLVNGVILCETTFARGRSHTRGTAGPSMVRHRYPWLSARLSAASACFDMRLGNWERHYRDEKVGRQAC